MISQMPLPTSTTAKVLSKEKLRTGKKLGVNGEGRSPNTRRQASEENIVNWKQKNIKDGFVVVDETQLTKLIKREPIEKYYKLEQEPFAKGLFASVRRCRSLETGENFAAKFSSRRRYGEDCSAEIYHEIALLSLCGSAPRIIQIHDVFETKSEIIIVMEYAPGGDLQTIIDDNLVPFESDVVSFIKQTAEGLEYLHRRKVAHLDIKPQNIVMMGDYPNCEIKLCDFEISRVILDGTDIREILGTPDYVAPEILHYEPITLAADMWSLGVTTYVLLTGFSPFGGETDQETFCNISRGELDLPEELFQDVSEDAVDFIKSLIVKNPSSRLSASACLRHAWLRDKSKEKSSDVEETITPDTAPRLEAEKPRSGCQSCGSSDSEKSLRKFLSKSREALFDKVVQHHKNNNLRKTTIKNQFFNKTRLCESQMSLISKSREKLLNNENMSPSFSRSIEKIYGLRSLSKSQEVLNLYKNGSLLASQENINIVSEILKSRENLVGDDSKERKLTRATTADLGVVRHRLKNTPMYSGSSTASLASLATEVQEEEEEKSKQDTNPEDVDAEKIPKEETKEGKTPEKLIQELSMLEAGRKVERRNSEEDSSLEPRFTVAQLVTAYNKHQEIVTKTSLEVTMTAQEKTVKIPPLITYKTKSSFPTGPTALRLFIPDIDLVELPRKPRPQYKIRFAESDTSEPTSGEWKSPDSSEPNSGEFDFSKEERKTEEGCNSKFLRSSSVSSETSTTVSTISGSSWEEITLKEVINTEPIEPPQEKPLLQKRSKSISPSPLKEEKEIVRKFSAGANAAPSSDIKNSTIPTRKISITKTSLEPRKTVEKSPLVQRKNSKAGKPDVPTRKVSGGTGNFKIVGLGAKSPNPCRKSYGVSYKIEFDSPIVSRKFPARNITKTTISSELKKQDTNVSQKLRRN